MSSLIITKQTGNFFSLVLDGGSPIISEQNRLTTIGNLCNFKTANGANLILKQNILYSEITIITGSSHVPTSINDLWISLIAAGFFNGVVAAGGTGATNFTALLDTFSSYIGRDGQVLVVNESMQKIQTIAISLFSDTDRAKLDGIETGADVNVNPDWNKTDPADPSTILNKPNLASAFSIENTDFARLILPQQIFQVPIGKVAKWALVNGTFYVLQGTNNIAEFNTFTQSGVNVTFKTSLEIGEYPVIFYQ